MLYNLNIFKISSYLNRAVHFQWAEFYTLKNKKQVSQTFVWNPTYTKFFFLLIYKLQYLIELNVFNCYILEGRTKLPDGSQMDDLLTQPLHTQWTQ